MSRGSSFRLTLAHINDIKEMILTLAQICDASECHHPREFRYEDDYGGINCIACGEDV